MLKLDITDPIQYKIMIHAFSIYKHEGMVKKLLEFVIKNPKFNIEIESTIFELGFFAEYENLLKYKDDIDFFDYEYKYASETLTQNELKKHINSIYKKRTLEIVQSTYLLAKAFNCVKESDIKKLVITNPYTKGLIKLMLALAEGEEVKKCALFQEAINNLIHIKYYYTEAILLYCRYLKSIHNSDYNKWFRIGKGIAIKYYFRYLIHCYENLDKERTDPYKQDSCESIVSIDGFESFISNLIRKKKKKGK
jgi:hypothetical protein